MAKGRQGLYLEAWKFSVYISLPIIASVYYADPERQKKMADYWQFISYPENPNTNVRQKIQELAKENEEQRERRLAYQRQLQELQRAAERSQNVGNDNGSIKHVSPNDPAKRSVSWWGRLQGWFNGSRTQKEDSSPTA
jgi:Pet100